MSKVISRVVCLAVLTAAILASSGLIPVFGQVPQIINYQGRIRHTDGSPVADGNYSMVFRIYDAQTAGNTLWSETCSTVQITGGLFQVLLGSVNPIGASVFAPGANRFLGVQVGTDPELAPRQKIVSVPNALRADTVSPGSIGSTELKSEAASLSKVSGGALTSSGGNVSATGTISGNGSGLTNLNGSNIATGTVAAARIDGAMATDSELTSHAAATTGVHGVGSGAVVGTTLTQTLTNKTLGSSNSVDGAAITSGSIGSAKLASDGASLAKVSGGVMSVNGANIDCNGRIYSHGTDFCLDGRSGGNKRALVDNTNQLIVNYGNDYSNGTLVMSDLTAANITANGGDLYVYPRSVPDTGGQITLKGAAGREDFRMDVYGGSWRVISQNKSLFDVDYNGVNVRTDYGLWVYGPLHVSGVTYHQGGCGDIAENVAVNPKHKGLTAGSVVRIDPDNPDQFTICSKAYDTMVAGVVSAEPNSIIEPTVADKDGNKRALSQVKDVIPLAVVGRVECLVDARKAGVETGDLLVSSGTPGYAMKGQDGRIKHGMVIGKALQKLPKGQKGKIKVLVTLQ